MEINHSDIYAYFSLARTMTYDLIYVEGECRKVNLFFFFNTTWNLDGQTHIVPISG